MELIELQQPNGRGPVWINPAAVDYIHLGAPSQQECFVGLRPGGEDAAEYRIALPAAEVAAIVNGASGARKAAMPTPPARVFVSLQPIDLDGAEYGEPMRLLPSIIEGWEPYERGGSYVLLADRGRRLVAESPDEIAAKMAAAATKDGASNE